MKRRNNDINKLALFIVFSVMFMMAYGVVSFILQCIDVAFA